MKKISHKSRKKQEKIDNNLEKILKVGIAPQNYKSILFFQLTILF